MRFAVVGDDELVGAQAFDGLAGSVGHFDIDADEIRGGAENGGGSLFGRLARGARSRGHGHSDRSRRIRGWRGGRIGGLLLRRLLRLLRRLAQRHCRGEQRHERSICDFLRDIFHHQLNLIIMSMVRIEAGAGDAAERRRAERGAQPRETRRVGKVLNFPADIQVVALLRAEAEGFRQRRVPIEFAGTFDRAAALVAIGRRRRAWRKPRY